MAKKALCIGINYVGTEHELSGCVNDADDWSRLLGTNGFDVGVLTEKQATKGQMVQTMRLLVMGLQPGDTGFITFSGHGSWVPDRNGDEPDGRDEAFCPVDLGDDGANLLLDDEVSGILAAVPAAAHLVLVTDCCHSGSVYRMAPGQTRRRVRFLPPAHFIKTDSLVTKMDRAFGQSVKKHNNPPPGVIHFSGCRDNEYSIDAEIEGRACGAFSYVATRAFAEVAAKGGSYADAHKLVRRHLPNWDFQQTPLLNAASALKKVKVFG